MLIVNLRKAVKMHNYSFNLIKTIIFIGAVINVSSALGLDGEIQRFPIEQTKEDRMRAIDQESFDFISKYVFKKLAFGSAFYNLDDLYYNNLGMQITRSLFGALSLASFVAKGALGPQDSRVASALSKIGAVAALPVIVPMISKKIHSTSRGFYQYPVLSKVFGRIADVIDIANINATMMSSAMLMYPFVAWMIYNQNNHQPSPKETE